MLYLRKFSIFRGLRSEVGYGLIVGYVYGGSEVGEEDDGLVELFLLFMIKRLKSVVGYRFIGGLKWEGSLYGDGMLMELYGRD